MFLNFFIEFYCIKNINAKPSKNLSHKARYTTNIYVQPEIITHEHIKVRNAVPIDLLKHPPSTSSHSDCIHLPKIANILKPCDTSNHSETACSLVNNYEKNLSHYQPDVHEITSNCHANEQFSNKKTFSYSFNTSESGNSDSSVENTEKPSLFDQEIIASAADYGDHLVYKFDFVKDFTFFLNDDDDIISLLLKDNFGYEIFDYTVKKSIKIWWHKQQLKLSTLNKCRKSLKIIIDALEDKDTNFMHSLVPTSVVYIIKIFDEFEKNIISIKPIYMKLLKLKGCDQNIYMSLMISIKKLYINLYDDKRAAYE